MLTQRVGIEDKVWMQIDDLERIVPIADEDMERSDEEKTSAVHFLRFELSAQQIDALRQGAELSAGIDHPNCRVEIRPIAENVRNSLMGDLS